MGTVFADPVSPRLSRHVHHLTILARLAILKPVLDAQLPCLRKLSFIFVKKRLRADQSGLIRDCISLTSIRDVEFTDLGRCLTDLHFVASFFDNYSPQLHSLVLFCVHPAPSPPAPRPVKHRLQIHRLQLYNTDLGPWVTSPSSPFDFTHLAEFGTDRYYDSPLQILPSARLSLTRLRTPSNYFNLSELPALTCLEFTNFGRQSLSNLNHDNCVERLIVHVIIAPWNWSSHELLTIDAIIASTPMPVLQQVELLIHSNLDFDVAQLKTYFPQLLNRSVRGQLCQWIVSAAPLFEF
ncbi:hypothetical protein FB451DRAFT_1553778 [Mycena latifolia]|nr:hypothetical protein FB451DRAFT_1553778 [Mycena latifolia]